jgi:hypothetical protein
MLPDRLGVLCLGSFVGFLLGFGLMKSNPSLRAALTVVGAALGGAPVAFLAGTEQKWLYPVGLLTGLLWVRVAGARVSKVAAPQPEHQSARDGLLLAWLDIVVIVVITGAVLLYTVVLPPQPTLEQTGEIRVTHSGDYEVFYPQPYVSTPSLSFPFGGSNTDDFRVIEQRADGFKMSVGGAIISGSLITWKATGKPKP